MDEDVLASCVLTHWYPVLTRFRSELFKVQVSAPFKLVVVYYSKICVLFLVTTKFYTLHTLVASHALQN